jgi:hypothetical protein
VNTSTRTAEPAPVYEPRRVPQLAADLITWLASDQAADSEEEAQFNPEGATGPRCPTHRTAEFIRSGRLFAVSAQMTGTSVAAGGQLAAYHLDERTPPYPSGLVVWHEPITNEIPVQDDVHVPVIAASWGRYSRGFEVRFWTTREHVIEALATVYERTHRATPAEVRRLGDDARARFAAPLVPVSSSVLYIDDAPEWPCPPLTTRAPTGADVALYLVQYMSAMESCERTLMATWMRMGEEVAVETREQADRAARKRIARLDPRLPSEVRLVTLRRVSEPLPAPTTGQDRGPLTYRQPVSKHWKNVYFPSTGTHEYREIAGYKRGPKDAPERESATPVGVLRR